MFRLLFLCIGMCVLLAGCGAKPEEKIYQILEETVSKEKGFQSQQSPLTKLESEETHIFEQIMGLGMKDYEKVVKLSDKALLNIKERKERMDKEQESMLASKNVFLKMQSIMPDLKDPSLKKEANELFNLMEKRYETHQKLYTSYMSGLEADQKLYELFQKQNVPINDLESQINATNESFSKVMDANKEFNKDTKTYNEKKLDFYKHAGIKSQSK
ncbi:YkyA family protein [Bacillus sp. FJAT-49736]|uniref:YkyA family protein n=1 Tax=Bacillus sp. FJAT-49736 TaxID=2833582 RepID=UPI002016029C|nr:YkyA family protein [Bacillus sp. FJAT-49736]